MGVAGNFSTFCKNLVVQNQDAISTRYKAITKRLNLDFRGLDSETAHSRYVGSYGRGTAIRGFSDLDMLYGLPSSLYQRYNNYTSNGQSALLQAVKTSIKRTYHDTDVGGDGQVVVVQFADGMRFEVVPAFAKDGGFIYPDANRGGKWKITNPIPEINALQARDKQVNGNLIRLCRMARAWRRKWSVPIGGLFIDTLAYQFIGSWRYRDKSYSYYDCMSLDFFECLANQNSQQRYWKAVGSGQHVYHKGPFRGKAKQCLRLAEQAIEHQKKQRYWAEKQSWRQIYGAFYPD